MASYTPNLNLYKPDDSDNYEDFREGFNENMDKLDQGGGNQNIATDYGDTQTYAVGDYVIYDGLLYKCVTAVTTAETFDPTKWTHVVVTDEMGSGGGSGDTVTWTQVQQTGTKIAEININGTSQNVYAPQGGGSGGHTIYDKDGTALTQESGLQFTGAVSVSDDSVNGRTVVDVEGGGNYYLNTLYSTEEKKIGYWTDGKPLYQKSFAIDTSNLNTGWNDISSGLSGIDCKDITGKFRFPANDNSIYEFPYTENSNYCLFGGYKPTNDTIFVYKGTGFATISDFVVTLRYTKNTDTADPNPQIGNVIYLPTIYSEEERQVGVWTDGKPLYQITVDVANPSNDSNEHLVDLSALSIEKCPYLFGYAVRHSGANDLTYYANSIETDGWYYFKARYDNFRDSIMYICLFKNDSISRMKFTIQYTKTTDTAGSGDWTPSGARAVHYSTNEQVIGTWVDGKPLYEKTWDNLSIGINGNNWVYFNDPVDIDNVISFDAYYINSDRLLHCAISEYQRSNSNGIMFSGFSGFNRTVNRIVAQYTKTTD